MDKPNKISIRINGEDTYLERKNLDEQAKDEILEAKEEQASAIEDWVEEQEKEKKKSNSDKDLTVLERAYQLKKKKFQFTTSIKHMVLAGMAAIMIGMVLGFVMLRLFAGMASTEANSVPAYQSNALPNKTTSEANDPATNQENSSTDKAEEKAEITKVPYPFPIMDAHVVQAGIFSTREKAAVWQSQLEEKGVTSFVWPRDGQFYLFTGIGSTKAEGDKIATLLKAQEIDTFTKPWQVSPKQKRIATTEGKWIESGMQNWKSSLGTIVTITSTGDGDLKGVLTKIQSWKQEIPDEATEQSTSVLKAFDKFSEAAQSYQTQKSAVSLWEMQVQLINIWYEYEKFIAPTS